MEAYTGRQTHELDTLQYGNNLKITYLPECYQIIIIIINHFYIAQHTLKPCCAEKKSPDRACFDMPQNKRKKLTWEADYLIEKAGED